MTDTVGDAVVSDQHDVVLHELEHAKCYAFWNGQLKAMIYT